MADAELDARLTKLEQLAEGNQRAELTSLSEKVRKLEELAEHLRRLMWLGGVLGLSFAGVGGYLWSNFRSVEQQANAIERRLADIDGRAAKLEKKLDPSAVEREARLALEKAAPNVLADVESKIPTWIKVVPDPTPDTYRNRNEFQFKCSGHYNTEGKVNKIVVGTSTGANNIDISNWCGSLELKTERDRPK